MTRLFYKTRQSKFSFLTACCILFLSAYNLLIYIIDIERAADTHSKLNAFFANDFTFPVLLSAAFGIIAALLIFYRYFSGWVIAMASLSLMTVYFLYRWSEFNNELTKSHFIYCYRGERFYILFALTVLCLILSILAIIRNWKLLSSQNELSRESHEHARNIDKIRVDIREMVERLCQPNRDEVDVYAVDDAIDFLNYIDDSYSIEKPFLISKLRESNDIETLNFIICVLKIMHRTLDEETIEILEDKVYIILSNNTTDHYGTLEYILQYFSKQGFKFNKKIIPVLLKIISSNAIFLGFICKWYSFYILWKWIGFWNAVASVIRGSYTIPEKTK